ncbi:MAG: OmpA family protein [Deltaproteobacteria bacterium]|nr:OmpA family protein [Deltaproteobacteria bacterium]
MIGKLSRIALALAVSCVAAQARAQTTSQGFALDQFDPAPRGSDFFQADSLDFRGDMRLAVGLTAELGYKPLVVYDLSGNEKADVVKMQLFAHAGASLVMMDRLRFNLSIPVAIAQSGDATTVNDVALQAASSAALGDPRIGADVRLLGVYGDPVTLALGADVYIPIGSTAQWAGDGKVRLQPHAIVSGQAMGLVEYSAEVGFTYRALNQPIAGSQVGSTLNFGAALGYRPMPELIIGPEVYGNTVTSNFFQKVTTPVEVIVGAHYQLGDYKLGAGFGPGLTRGVGTPEFRGLLSFDYAPQFKEPVKDRDADGVPDEQDACPDQAGIKTDNPATNGCPDRDKDGIPDVVDACPDQPGPKTANLATNGCPPPPPDRDKDGIPDEKDACPDVAGVPSNDPKKNGCPRDIDGDGIPDTEDACPDIPGIKTNDPKTNGCPGDRDGDGIRDDQDACPDQPGIPELKGCPDVDTDKDGVPDRFDNCPKEPGPKENGGCPVKQKQLVVITREKLEIKDKIYFDTDKSTIQKKSFKLLDQIASVIKSHPAITKVRIEGHTDNVGKAEHNRKLSQDRANSVRDYLVKHGVEANRLESQGFGPDRPIDTNKTAKGRANNRRVEFVIVQPEAPAGTPAPPEATPAVPKQK